MKQLDQTHRGNLDGISGDFNEIEVVDAGYVVRAKEQYRVAQAIGARLVRAYNSRQWKVIVDIENQMLIIGCDSVSNVKGMHIHMVGRTLHDLELLAVKVAGEILERHQLTRAKIFDADIIETLDRDFMDSVITPDSAAEPI